MERTDLYKDIAVRTNGDIYIGVVGPVRTGKSTFITKFMQSLVLPNMNNAFSKERAKDELPQSADGKTIMTTQPKFVPNEAVKVQFKDKVEANIRLIDCVGYLIDGVAGHTENGQQRMVKTPWSDKEMPFEKAAEIGTKKVINEHSTIGMLVTTDGSIGELPRAAYVPAEERVVRELKEISKPFVILLNSKSPKGADCKKLQAALEERYGVPVIASNILEMSIDDINLIMEKVLMEFPFDRLDVDIPKWMSALDFDSPIIQSIVETFRQASQNIYRMKDYTILDGLFTEHDELESNQIVGVKMGDGSVMCQVSAKQQLFYKVLSQECGSDISDDFKLISYVKSLSEAKIHYDRLKSALDDVESKGYGIVNPSMDALELEEPQIVKQGSRYGVRLRAKAPSLHIMKVEVAAEVNPIVGSEQESQYMLKEFESNPKAIWDTNMFGKSLSMLAKESISNKIYHMPLETQSKMRKTLSRIINEGKGGVICILL